MPGLDRLGPEGKGSQTGRKMGKCNPKKTDTNDTTEQDTSSERGRLGLGRNQLRGQGQGLGRRLGNGNGNGAGRGMRRND